MNLAEADAHAMHAVKNDIKRIIVLSSDTDVMILMLYYWDHLHYLGLNEVWVKAGVGILLGLF